MKQQHGERGSEENGKEEKEKMAEKEERYDDAYMQEHNYRISQIQADTGMLVQVYARTHNTKMYMWVYIFFF